MNKKLYINLAKYILIVILIIYYFTILFNATKPQVCKEYKMHYLDKTLLDWPGYGGLNYILNTNLMFGSDYKENIAKCKGVGWYEIENQATWTGDKATLYFNLTDEINDNGILKLVLRGAMPEVNVNISINGHDIASFFPSKERKEYEFFVPKEVVNEKFLNLTFKIDNCKHPSDLGNSNDQRLLGIYIESINLK